ncbi:MAG: DUF262 domain-containing protein [Acidobacteria bacterium]|nr:DUF262 domain-containing protein [Acidobacteriota bacterium]
MPEDDDQLSLIEISPEELEPVGGESEDDLQGLDAKSLSEAVVFATDWTAETILRQMERGNIYMNPKYQRRDAWRAATKSRFIESLILGLPVPPLVLAEAKGKRGSYIVIDGKQRLLTIRQFAASHDDSSYPQLKLRDLEIRRGLNGKSLHDLKSDPEAKSDRDAFENQTIRTVVLRNWPNDSFLHLVFLRLNTGTVQLSPQELRQALSPGPFVDFAVEYSGKSVGLKRLLNSTHPDFRMRDVELLVRFYAFRNFLDTYKGNLKAFLDHTCSQLNREWETRKGALEHQAEEFEAAVETTFEIFGNNACRKSDGNGYERRLNRAVFDVMVYFFAIKEIRDDAVQHGAALAEEFKRICGQRGDFLKAIESTTKSVSATQTRLAIWGDVLSRITSKHIDPPKVG